MNTNELDEQVSPIAALAVSEASFALQDGIGSAARSYTLKMIEQMADVPNVVLAFKDAIDPVYVLIDDSEDIHRPKSKAIFMLQLAVDVTRYMRTMVIPTDSPRPTRAVWAGKSRGPFVVYSFRVVEPGVTILYG